MLIETIIEAIFGVSLFINASLFLPQIIRLYRTRDTEGFSLITFAGFNVLQFIMFLHGYLHDDYLLMLGMVVSFIACGAVTMQLLLYRNKPERVLS